MLAVALGVAVVAAIDLAGDAAHGIFRSSIESLTGKADYEVSAVGGLDESLLRRPGPAALPIRFAPRVEGYAIVEPDGRECPGLWPGPDRRFDPRRSLGERPGRRLKLEELQPTSRSGSARLSARSRARRLRLQINDETRDYAVRGILQADGFQGVSRENVVVIDIAAAQRALGKQGRFDRPVQIPRSADGIRGELGSASARCAAAGRRRCAAGHAHRGEPQDARRVPLEPADAELHLAGGGRVSHLQHDFGFRGAAAAGDRRPARAGRDAEQACWRPFWRGGGFRTAGMLLGLRLGRVMAEGAVELMAATVHTLYVSSAPGADRDHAGAAADRGGGRHRRGAASRLAPAREAARVAPSEAMARGRREYDARLRAGRDLAMGGVAGGLAAGLAPCSANRRNAGLRLPGCAAADWAPRCFSGPRRTRIARAGSRGGAARCSASKASWLRAAWPLRWPRTSMLVGALSTAIAMMVSVGIMVGSFRETVQVWMDHQLRADLFVRPAGDPAPTAFPRWTRALADRLAALPPVEDIDRFRAYPISYDGAPATLGAGDPSRQPQRHGRVSCEGPARTAILRAAAPGRQRHRERTICAPSTI